MTAQSVWKSNYGKKSKAFSSTIERKCYTRWISVVHNPTWWICGEIELSFYVTEVQAQDIGLLTFRHWWNKSLYCQRMSCCTRLIWFIHTNCEFIIRVTPSAWSASAVRGHLARFEQRLRTAMAKSTLKWLVLFTTSQHGLPRHLRGCMMKSFTQVGLASGCYHLF